MKTIMSTAQRIQQKAQKRATRFGLDIERASETTSKKLQHSVKRRIALATNARETRYAYHMTMQTVIGKMIKMFEIKNHTAKTELNKLSNELAKKNLSADKIGEQEIAKKMAELITKEKGPQAAQTFMRMLDWEIVTAWNHVQKEREQAEKI